MMVPLSKAFQFTNIWFRWHLHVSVQKCIPVKSREPLVFHDFSGSTLRPTQALRLFTQQLFDEVCQCIREIGRSGECALNDLPCCVGGIIRVEWRVTISKLVEQNPLGKGEWRRNGLDDHDQYHASKCAYNIVMQ